MLCALIRMALTASVSAISVETSHLLFLFVALVAYVITVIPRQDTSALAADLLFRRNIHELLHDLGCDLFLADKYAFSEIVLIVADSSGKCKIKIQDLIILLEVV